MTLHAWSPDDGGVYDGAVIVEGDVTDAGTLAMLSPADARELAAMLLAAADHADGAPQPAMTHWGRRWAHNRNGGNPQ